MKKIKRKEERSVSPRLSLYKTFGAFLQVTVFPDLGEKQVQEVGVQEATDTSRTAHHNDA